MYDLIYVCIIFIILHILYTRIFVISIILYMQEGVDVYYGIIKIQLILLYKIKYKIRIRDFKYKESILLPF